MCGIAGIVHAELSPNELRFSLLNMQEAMFHRGPDEGAMRVVTECRMGLCARRLSIVDLEQGSQPVANEDETVFAVLNGEIYNHDSLREKLISFGHRFRGHSDTEALVHLYEQYGTECLHQLRGMFALAIYDTQRRRLLLARDPAGMKPLYFARTSRGFMFASEVKALFASGLIRPEPDTTALNVYLAAGFVPAPLSPYRGIEKLTPGHYLVIDSSEREDTFWQLRSRPADLSRSDQDYANDLDNLLTATVRSHLAADVEVGAFLSGGWDSSLIASKAAETVGRKLKTFSIVFPDNADADESRFSRLMANHLGSDHHEIEYRNALLPSLLPKIARHVEEPVSNVPTALLFVVASLAARHVKTVVSGEGADELFGGYERLRVNYPYALRRVVPKYSARLFSRWCGQTRLRRGLRILGAADDRAADAEWMRPFSPEDKLLLLRPEYRQNGDDLEPVLIRTDVYESCRETLQRRLCLEVSGRLANAILLDTDKMSMAHSLEVRMPFLDRSIVEFAFGLPSHLRVHRSREKVILSELARRHLPAEIALRRKKGLAYPIGAWRSSPLKEYVRELLLDSEGPFDTSYLRQQLPLWLSGRTRRDRELYCLVALQTWWNEFFHPTHHYTGHATAGKSEGLPRTNPPSPLSF
jgi:asparagine synthase (glutamine-hydrolysing)